MMMRTLLVGFIALIIIGIITGTIIKTTILFFLLLPLRQYSGGFHLQSKHACAVLSAGILAGMALMMKFVLVPEIIQMMIIVCGGTVIISNAPVDNPNNPLDIDIKKIFRKKALITLAIEAIAFMVLFLLKLYAYSQIVVLAVGLTALLLIGGLIVNGLHGTEQQT